MVYTAEEVDEQIRRLERDVERQVATMGSSVKGVAAERDLLRSAELSRDLLGQAVKGAKEYLDKVFGGSCERIGRYRLALDAVRFSEMHATDARWQDLRKVVETIEAVLRDLGTFKPWVPPSAKPPAKLVYRGLRRRLSPGRRVNLRPELEGGEVAEFEVRPPLPASLELSTTTGHVSGTLALGVSVAETTYTVVARNAAGEASCELAFLVSEPPPSAVAYPAACDWILVGEPVLWEAEAQGGGSAASTWSVEPALPAGLALDAASGRIAGAAAEATPSAVYEVSVLHPGGRASISLQLEVRMAPPASLRYPGVPERLLTGRQVRLEPEVSGAPSEWTVEPDLPKGLVLDASSGVVSGAPTEGPSTWGTWTVRAANAEGSAVCEIAFRVEPAPPSGLAYSGLERELTLLRPLEAVTPMVEGQVDSFAVSPPLPPGLSLDESTGAIGGTPSATAEEATYEVSARNATGSATVQLVLSVRMAPPGALAYASLRSAYGLGEQVLLEAEAEGPLAERFAVAPLLPRDLVLDEATGAISGVTREVAAEATYVVSASNGAGEASRGITFAVVPPAPAELIFPMASPSFAVGELVHLEPQVEMAWGPAADGAGLGASACGCAFRVAPALPEGLALDAATGVVSGSPTAPSELASYRLTVENGSGSASTDLAFEAVETVNVETVNEAFAAKLDEITDLAGLAEVQEPQVKKFPGDWMIWMVHRAFLNDPTLVDFDFSNMHMPPPHIEARIAPKLMTSLATNTCVEVLSLPNANLMKVQGADLAAALAQNRTLRSLNVESNNLDSGAIKEVADAIHSNSESRLEQLRVLGQKGSGAFFGRPVEEAVGQMMERNQTICKLGFQCDDAHWRNMIDRALLRNNDFARRRRKREAGAEDDEAELAQAEEKALSRLLLLKPPAASATEVFAEASAESATFRSFVAQQKRLPNPSQLQSCAKNLGAPLKYSQVAPLLKECRGRLLDAAVNAEVTVADIFEADMDCILRKWSASNDNWSFEVRAPDGKRYEYKSNKEPVFLVSDAWADWLGAA